MAQDKGNVAVEIDQATRVIVANFAELSSAIMGED
jgi:hypothetical protein